MRWIIIISILFAYSAAFSKPQQQHGPLAFELTEKYPDGTGYLTGTSFDEIELWDVNDSLFHIPAYDTYCKWDTETIHAYGFDLTTKKDTSSLHLIHEDCDYHIPCAGAVTSDFGMRGSRYHYGIDLKLEIGDSVRVAFEGLVRIAQYSSTYGNVIVVRHPNGLETIYAHLSKMLVNPGIRLEAGEIIGLGGNTGRSHGAHLHFECRFMGEPLNPNDLIDFYNGRLKSPVIEISARNFDYLKETRSARYHKVKSGDNLSVIASKYGTSVSALCKLNNIRREKILRPGQVLRYF